MRFEELFFYEYKPEDIHPLVIRGTRIPPEFQRSGETNVTVLWEDRPILYVSRTLRRFKYFTPYKYSYTWARKIYKANKRTIKKFMQQALSCQQDVRFIEANKPSRALEEALKLELRKVKFYR